MQSLTNSSSLLFKFHGGNSREHAVTVNEYFERLDPHEMLNVAREGNWGELPMVVSGYRTQEKQQSLYDEKIAKFKKEGYSDSEAVEQAEQWVAVPGYSEPQLISHAAAEK